MKNTNPALQWLNLEDGKSQRTADHELIIFACFLPSRRAVASLDATSSAFEVQEDYWQDRRRSLSWHSLDRHKQWYAAAVSLPNSFFSLQPPQVRFD